MDGETRGFPITALREIQILKSLDHPNLVKLEDVFVRESRSKDKNDWKSKKVNLVFEYVPHDLFAIVKNRPKFTPAQLKCILKQMLEGLAYLNSKGFLHRDIKGGNILLSEKGVVKLCDFGLARHLDQLQMSDQKKLNLTSKIVTRWYRAPELFLGSRTYDEKIDVWSLGCVFIELLASNPPFMGETDDKTLKL